MKPRILLLTIAALLYLSLTSCIKNWVCTCDQTIYNNGSVASNAHEVHEMQTGKLQAQEECNELEVDHDYGNGSYISTTCTLE